MSGLPELEEVVARALGVPRASIGPGARPRVTEGWDSVRHVELVVELERAYGVAFTLGEAAGLDSLAAVRAALRAKGVAV
jgi:acyl carrier protein